MQLRDKLEKNKNKNEYEEKSSEAKVDDYAITETRDGSHGIEAEPKPRR